MIRLTTSLSKKIPHPIHQYGSISASASLEVELSSERNPVAEAESLFQRLDQALDQELTRQARASPVAPPSAPAATRQEAPPAAPSQSTGKPSSRPYPPQKRAPAPITVSQLRYLDRLFTDTKTDPAAVAQEFEVGSIAELSCRDAARLIDDLKAKVPVR